MISYFVGPPRNVCENGEGRFVYSSFGNIGPLSIFLSLGDPHLCVAVARAPRCFHTDAKPTFFFLQHYCDVGQLAVIATNCFPAKKDGKEINGLHPAVQRREDRSTEYIKSAAESLQVLWGKTTGNSLTLPCIYGP